MCLLLALHIPRAFLGWPLTVLNRQTRQVVCDIKHSIFLRCVWSKLRKARRQYPLFGFEFLPLNKYSNQHNCPKGLRVCFNRFLCCKIINFLILRFQITHWSKLALNAFSQHCFHQFIDCYIFCKNYYQEQVILGRARDIVII
jgi:hypothetical protein